MYLVVLQIRRLYTRSGALFAGQYIKHVGRSLMRYWGGVHSTKLQIQTSVSLTGCGLSRFFFLLLKSLQKGLGLLSWYRVFALSKIEYEYGRRDQKSLRKPYHTYTGLHPWGALSVDLCRVIDQVCLNAFRICPLLFPNSYSIGRRLLRPTFTLFMRRRM